MNRYEIKEPVRKDNSIGIAEFRLKNDLLVDITYKNKSNERVFPDTYIIKNRVGIEETIHLVQSISMTEDFCLGRTQAK